jgi:saccharopine dehydrogenase (NADP+, L-glutamate forming)
MKNILLFGAGKSATVLIEYLTRISQEKQWKVIVADADLQTAHSKVGEHEWIKAIGLSIMDAPERVRLIQEADVVISMLPPALHSIVAADCLQFGKHLLTASYVDEQIRSMADSIKEKQVLFLCEMGLDPGIDHMSALQLIHRIRKEGGKINSFISHCGGLVAPESDDNPWHYKLSWNPRSVVLAGKAGGMYREKFEVRSTNYEDLYTNCKEIDVPDLGHLAYYPNRDSLSYLSLYGLEEIETFKRTTLRYPSFCKGWSWVIKAGLTDDDRRMDTTDLTIGQFLQARFKEKGIDFESLDPIVKDQLIFLGWNDHSLLKPGERSIAETLQLIVEDKWKLKVGDKDMIVMLHEIEYEVKSEKLKVKSRLIVSGEDNMHTAMAKTVGLPLGIAARLLLEGKITVTGLQIPTIAEIYEPVLLELENEGIRFIET